MNKSIDDVAGNPLRGLANSVLGMGTIGSLAGAGISAYSENIPVFLMSMGGAALCGAILYRINTTPYSSRTISIKETQQAHNHYRNLQR